MEWGGVKEVKERREAIRVVNTVRVVSRVRVEEGGSVW